MLGKDNMAEELRTKYEQWQEAGDIFIDKVSELKLKPVETLELICILLGSFIKTLSRHTGIDPHTIYLTAMSSVLDTVNNKAAEDVH